MGPVTERDTQPSNPVTLIPVTLNACLWEGEALRSKRNDPQGPAFLEPGKGASLALLEKEHTLQVQPSTGGRGSTFSYGAFKSYKGFSLPLMTLSLGKILNEINKSS